MSAAVGPVERDSRNDGGMIRPPGGSVLDSARLLEGRREVRIRHAGEVYLLRLTRNGKLILNK